jgi:hypothetical protein
MQRRLDTRLAADRMHQPATILGSLLLGCLLLGWLCLAPCTGCTTASPDGVMVTLTSNPEAVRGCEYLAEIRGRAGARTGTGPDTEDPALDDLRRRAASIGADTVLIVATEPGLDDPVYRGRAYLCGSRR